MQNQLLKLHYERCEDTTNGVRVPPRRLTIFYRTITFAFFVALTKSCPHEISYTGQEWRALSADRVVSHGRG